MYKPDVKKRRVKTKEEGGRRAKRQNMKEREKKRRKCAQIETPTLAVCESSVHWDNPCHHIRFSILLQRPNPLASGHSPVKRDSHQSPDMLIVATSQIRRPRAKALISDPTPD